MVQQMITELVWAEGAADYFEAGDEGTEKTTVEELRACPHMASKTRKELEEIHAEAEILILEADCDRLGALKWLALMNEEGITGEPGEDGLEGLTEDELQDCTFMDGMSQEELECLLAQAEGAIWEATNQRASALKRLALVS